jgi:demethylmenaquinone methyltransferase/2-methoxy-6-polyprenyl-1,4-benzoquinol methylase
MQEPAIRPTNAIEKPVDSSSDLGWDNAALERPHDRRDKAARVRNMFNAIAPTYRFVNSLFSGGRDRAWRRKAVRLAQVQTDDRILDIACGTGDFLTEFTLAPVKAHRFVGTDFAHEMLMRAANASRDHRALMKWCEADALLLPFADESFTIASCAFGVRNFQCLTTGLREMARILAAGGKAVIVEFSLPKNRVVRPFIDAYTHWFMPKAAAIISRDKVGAYQYLPKSVDLFLTPEEMIEQLRGAGFDQPAAYPVTFGMVTIYIATKTSHE